MVRDGVALTPPVNDDLLEGVTRKAMMELLENEKIPVLEPSIDRSELHVADDVARFRRSAKHDDWGVLRGRTVGSWPLSRQPRRSGRPTPPGQSLCPRIVGCE